MPIKYLDFSLQSDELYFFTAHFKTSGLFFIHAFEINPSFILFIQRNVFVIIIQVHLSTCRKTLKVSNIRSTLPEERIRDRLEMSFSRPSQGGGEVESLEYKQNLGTGQVTFLHPGGTRQYNRINVLY